MLRACRGDAEWKRRVASTWLLQEAKADMGTVFPPIKRGGGGRRNRTNSGYSSEDQGSRNGWQGRHHDRGTNLRPHRQGGAGDRRFERTGRALRRGSGGQWRGGGAGGAAGRPPPGREIADREIGRPRGRDRSRRSRSQVDAGGVRCRGKGLRHGDGSGQQCRRGAFRARRRACRGGLAARALDQSRRGVLLGAGSGPPHARRRPRRRHRQHRLGARFQCRQGRHRLCHGQGRRDPAHQGAGARARLQGYPRQRHRARLDTHRYQSRLSCERTRRADEAPNPDGPLRRGARSRRPAAAARRPTPGAT